MGKPKLNIILFVFLIIGFAYGITEFSGIQKRVNNSREYFQDLYITIDWLKANTDEEDVVLTQWTLGPFFYGMSDSNVIATSKVYPSEVQNVGERYADIARFFFSQSEQDALKTIRKYNVTYVIVPVSFAYNMCGYINSCALSSGNKTIVNRMLANQSFDYFDKVHNNQEFMVYKVLEFENKEPEFQNQLNYSLDPSKKSKKESSQNIFGTIVPHDVDHADQLIVENLQLIPQQYDRIIMLGPDHRSRGGYPITSSDAAFSAFPGEFNLDIGTIRELKLPIDNEIHRQEWSINTLIPFVQNWDSNISIIPILFRYDASFEDSVSLGKKLAQQLDGRTLLLASIDFSHIMPANQELSFYEDSKSLHALENFQIKEIDSLVTEGKPALVAMLTALEGAGANKTRLLNISSASYPRGNSSQSVGYISMHYTR